LGRLAFIERVCGSIVDRAAIMENPVLLLVEDEALVAEALQVDLEEGGYQVVLADDGQAALEAIDSNLHDFAGVITDIRIGAGPDGWDVARRGREVKPTVVVVYITGDSAADWAAKGVPNSIVLQKPFADAQLVIAVSTLLNQAGNSQA
jgi:DNA-binding response OmpR family regulator